VPFQVALTDVVDPPTYQKIAKETILLSQLGMNPNRIAGHLGVDRTTVTGANRWVRSNYLGM
jgi:hypothetical protein